LHGQCYEVVLCQVLAEGLEATLAINDVFPHHGRHPCSTVDPYKVGRQIHSCMAGTKVDLKKMTNEHINNNSERQPKVALIIEIYTFNAILVSVLFSVLASKKH
jgi:hypothetical protein